MRKLQTLFLWRNRIVGFVIRATALCFLALTAAFFTVATAAEAGKEIPAAGGDNEIVLWPAGRPADAVPLEESQIAKLKSQTTEERIHYVGRPTLTVFAADKESANGCAVVICPGGGYNILAWPKEGTEVAEWFNSIGVTAFVLKYRVPRRAREEIHWEPMQDVQRAIRIVRQQAEKWNIDPTRIGTLGFSAGGHLTVMSGVQYETESYPRVDDADDLSCRPDFICPIYAAYLADDYQDDVAELGSLVKVTQQTPPTFMAVTWDDKMRGAQAALLLVRLKEHGVPAELHVYSKGGHGYGIRPSDNPVSSWHHQLANWLQASGLLDSSQLTDSTSQPGR
jgi:acetyl esterase/lipase